MKKIILSGLLAGLLALSACGSPRTGGEEGTVRILATTYPVYLFTTAVTEGAEGVEVDLLVNQSVSCLHNYTLTVNDMKAIEGADVIVMNGAGLEDFMGDALAASDAAVIDCSEGLDLLPAQGHEGHNHDTEYDPHIWMDPRYAVQMMGQISAGLGELDEAQKALYTGNVVEADMRLREEIPALSDTVVNRELITFHDGFQYFAGGFGLTVLKAIEEEEGSEASAAEIKEIVALIRAHDIPAIFTEKNGSDATAQAVARETGVAVYSLDMIMSGDGRGIGPYIDAISGNIDTIAEALG